MKTFTLFILAVSLLPLTAAAKPEGEHPVEVTMKNTAGKTLGTAKITALKTGVNVHLELSGLNPGEHAIHFHAKGVCTGPDFKSAGDHLSLPGTEHGFDSPKGPHAGDMRNFKVGADGKAALDVKDEHVTLGAGPASLLREGGTALVIHAKADDYKSQPAGNAGDRVACGEIRGK